MISYKCGDEEIVVEVVDEEDIGPLGPVMDHHSRSARFNGSTEEATSVANRAKPPRLLDVALPMGAQSHPSGRTPQPKSAPVARQGPVM